MVIALNLQLVPFSGWSQAPQHRRSILAAVIPGVLIGPVLAGWAVVHAVGAAGALASKATDEKRLTALDEGQWSVILPVRSPRRDLSGGVFTPTEAAVVGLCFTVLALLLSREMEARDMLDATISWGSSRLYPCC